MTTDAGPPFAVHFALIDYSLSMIYRWRHSYKSDFLAPMYDQSVRADVGIVVEAVEAVTKVSDDTIETIVDRIPASYLNGTDKEIIFKGLAYRRNNLRRIVGSRYTRVAP